MNLVRIYAALMGKRLKRYGIFISFCRSLDPGDERQAQEGDQGRPDAITQGHSQSYKAHRRA